MKLLTYTLLISFFLISCKSPKKTVSSSRSEQITHTDDDIVMTDNKQLSELADRIINRMLSERLEIDIRQVKYDTDKPMHKESGKYPVMEDIAIGINRQTDVCETDSMRQQTKNTSTVVYSGHSNSTTILTTETKEKNEVGLKKWQKALIVIGTMTIAGFVVFLIARIKRF